jgi:3',5'-cyclic AMP phosphodiesterase CpdA
MLLVLAVVLLVVFLNPATSRATVTAYQIDSGGNLFSGDYADGQIDDYVLENDLIAVLISDIDHTGYYTVSGGNILDAGSSSDWIDALAELYTYFDDTWPRQADYSTIEILDDGSGGGQAAIRVTGVDSDDASLTVVTDYILNDGAEYVTIVTTITNTGGSTHNDFEMGDGFHWGACDTYIPGYGFAHTDTTHEPWITGTAEAVSYGYTSPPVIMWGDHGGYWSDVNVSVDDLGPGDSTGYQRTFIVGGEDVASVATIAHQVWGTATGAAICTVSSQSGGVPISDAEIDVYDTLGAPYLQMEMDADGEGFTTLPAGDWRLVASAFGYHPEETWLTMTAGDTANHHFVLEPDTMVPPKGDTLTVIQRPLLNIPALVTTGDTLEISCDADPAATGWTAQLQYELLPVPLTILSSSYDATTLWWTLEVQIPAVPLYELYDLIVTADDGIADTTWNAVRVISEVRDDYYFVHITDTHLPTHLYYFEPGAETDSSEMEDLRAVMADIDIINPEFVLLTGDVINEGELEDYLNRRYFTRTQRLLAESRVPIYVTTGNHDVGGWDSTPPPDGTARRDWWRFFGWGRLDDPPPGAPWHTQNYSFDYGSVHFIGMDSYLNYDGWRPGIYGDRSFTTGQMQWLADDLADAAGSISQVLFYHFDFSDQIDLGSLGVEMALWGHIHRDEGSISSPPYDLATDNTCDGARSYRLIRVQDGYLVPSATVSAGYSGTNLDVQYIPANDGQHWQVTAEIDNNLDEPFEYAQLRFHMPKDGGEVQVTGGSLIQIDTSGDVAVCYVAVNIPANDTHMVTVTMSPPPVNDLSPTLSGDDLMLSWRPPAGATIARYVVYRDTDPGFTPSHGDSIGDTTDTTYIDAGAGNTPDYDHYYAVKAVNDSGQKSEPSNVVGEFDVTLGNAR